MSRASFPANILFEPHNAARPPFLFDYEVGDASNRGRTDRRDFCGEDRQQWRAGFKHSRFYGLQRLDDSRRVCLSKYRGDRGLREWRDFKYLVLWDFR
jgi:hypothetical protein